MPCSKNARANFYLCAAKCASDTIRERLTQGNLRAIKSQLVEELIINRYCGCPRLERIESYYYQPLQEALRSLELCAVSVEANVEQRLLVGVGAGVFKASLEVGLTWDPIFDLPVVPGSAVKGAVRNYLLRQIANISDLHSRKKCLEAVLELLGAGPRVFAKDELKWARDVWGNVVVEVPAGGLVMFFDAYPIKAPEGGCILEPDVVTPHYYRGGQVVEDEFRAEPSPVQHFAIAEGTRFRFVIASYPLPRSLIERLSSCLGLQASNTCGLVASILMQTLLNHGLGARTSKGYGYFIELQGVVIAEPRFSSRRGAQINVDVSNVSEGTE